MFYDRFAETAHNYHDLIALQLWHDSSSLAVIGLVTA